MKRMQTADGYYLKKNNIYYVVENEISISLKNGINIPGYISFYPIIYIHIAKEDRTPFKLFIFNSNNFVRNNFFMHYNKVYLSKIIEKSKRLKRETISKISIFQNRDNAILFFRNEISKRKEKVEKMIKNKETTEKTYLRYNTHSYKHTESLEKWLLERSNINEIGLKIDCPYIDQLMSEISYDTYKFPNYHDIIPCNCLIDINSRLNKLKFRQELEESVYLKTLRKRTKAFYANMMINELLYV